jgi:hypothetical protein
MIRALLALLALALPASAQNLATFDTGWVRCDGGTGAVSIPLSDDPCADLVIEPLVLEYRYTLDLTLHPAAPSAVWIEGEPGSVVYWLSEHRNTTWNPYTGPNPWVPPLCSPQAGGGSWATLLDVPGDTIALQDVTTFYGPIAPQVSPNARHRFGRRGVAWLTPTYIPSGQGAVWLFMGNHEWSHSPVAWSQPVVEARMVAAVRWEP